MSCEFMTAAGELMYYETVPSPPLSDEAIERVRELAQEHGIEIIALLTSHR